VALHALDLRTEGGTDVVREDSALRLLTRHFLRRLLDNDLISPNTDRHETLVVGATLLISSGLFIAVLVASKYLLDPFPTPVRTVILGIHDRFLFVSLSMVVMALVAAAQWDALSIDARDAAILGPIPIGHGVIVLAKVAALAIFTSAFVVIMNAGETVLFPLFLAARLPVSLFDIATLLFAHGLVTLAAGGFGVACVVAIRELLRACLGARLFDRVSTVVQAALVVLGFTALLVLPGFNSRTVRASLGNPTVAVEWLPPLWFVGLHETIAGDVIARIPAASTHQPNVRAFRLPHVIVERERDAAAYYRKNRARFRLQAQTAVTALALVVGVALASFAWNNRRLPFGLPARAPTRRWWRRLSARGIERWIIPSSAAQAGFFFTLQVLPRSAAHRVGMAAAVAAGLASLVIAFSGVALTHIDGPPARLGVWAAQSLLLAAVLGGLRHAVRVPADLKASASFLMAWPGEERAYLGGVKRAAVVALAAPVIVLLLPLHVVLLGRETAALHALCGLALAITLLEALTCGMRHPPFVCAYVPAGSFKRAAPIYLVGTFIACYLFGAIERRALESASGSAVLLGVLGLMTGVLRWRDRATRHQAPDLEIDPGPEPAVQTIDLRG
jgi:hypothetical protein